MAATTSTLPSSLRAFPMDGALLWFDRDSGLHALCDGPDTVHCTRQAPRVVQFAITNACNLTCGFCSRDLDDRSSWTAADAFALLSDLAAAGTLEVAFGGGEPFAFAGFTDLVRRLHDETPLAVGVTTNGRLLTRERVRAIAGHVGQVRLSVYDGVPWEPAADLLVDAQVPFGINSRVTPERLPFLEEVALAAHARGAEDVLLLSYNGRARMSPSQTPIRRVRNRGCASGTGMPATTAAPTRWSGRCATLGRQRTWSHCCNP